MFPSAKKKHQSSLKNYTKGSNAASHAWQDDHSTDFNNAGVIDKANTASEKP